jgi:hypothetical protein
MNGRMNDSIVVGVSVGGCSSVDVALLLTFATSQVVSAILVCAHDFAPLVRVVPRRLVHEPRNQ